MKTYAQIAQNLSKKESKYKNKMKKAPTTAHGNSARLMLDRIAKAKQRLIEDNRAHSDIVSPPQSVPSFALGGDPPSSLPAVTRVSEEELLNRRLQFINDAKNNVIRVPESELRTNRSQFISDARNNVTHVPQSELYNSRAQFIQDARNNVTYAPESDLRSSREQFIQDAKNNVTRVPESELVAGREKFIRDAKREAVIVPRSDLYDSRSKFIADARNTVTRVPQSELYASRDAFLREAKGASAAPAARTPSVRKSPAVRRPQVTALDSPSLRYDTDKDYYNSDISADTSGLSSYVPTVPTDTNRAGFLSRLFGGGKNSKPGTGSKGGSLLDTGMDALGAIAPFIDNAAFSKYKKNVKGDSTPELYSSPRMETAYDISPQVAAAMRAQRSLYSNLDNSNTNRGTSNANKVAGYTQGVRTMGELLSQKSNMEQQLRNQASQVRTETNNKNVNVRNQHAQNNVDFQNQRAYMDYLQAQNISEDLGDINAQRLAKQEQENALRILAPYYNMNGMLQKYAAQYAQYLNAQ